MAPTRTWLGRGGKGCLHARGNVRGIAGTMRGRIWLAFCSLGTRYPLPLLQDTPHPPTRLSQTQTFVGVCYTIRSWALQGAGAPSGYPCL